MYKRQIEAKAVPIALDCLLGLAHVLEQKGEFEPALELTEHVLRNPASPQDSSDCARQLSARLRAGLGPERLKAARPGWKAKTFEEITAEVVR